MSCSAQTSRPGERAFVVTTTVRPSTRAVGSWFTLLTFNTPDGDEALVSRLCLGALVPGAGASDGALALLNRMDLLGILAFRLKSRVAGAPELGAGSAAHPHDTSASGWPRASWGALADLSLQGGTLARPFAMGDQSRLQAQFLASPRVWVEAISLELGGVYRSVRTAAGPNAT